MKKVLCVLENGFEEIEAITPVDLLRRAGVEVLLAGVSGMEVTGKSGVTILAEALLEDVSEDGFDALFLPGGPAVTALRKNAAVISLIRKFSEEEKLIAAICAAPLLLHDAGILEGKNFTAHFTTADELPASNGERVILDGSILTSRGAGTAMDFGLELVGILAGNASRGEVSDAVMCLDKTGGS